MARMSKPDFSKRTRFPGTNQNSFATLLAILDAIDRMPAPFFAALLFGLCLTGTRGQGWQAAGLWLFCLSDWALLLALPRAGKSFGPAQPPALALALMRAPLASLLLLFSPPATWAAQALGTMLVIYGFWIEPHRLTLTRQLLRSPKLKSRAPLKVMHLGDIHMERFTNRERQLIAMVRETQPDLILYSGDFLNLSYRRDAQAWADTRAVLSQLSAPLGVFVVTGSPAVDLEEVVPPLLAGLPVRWLRDERVTVERDGQAVDVVGLSCTHKPFVDGPRLEEVLGGPPRRFTILLYHTPDLALEAAAAGIDLQLSGHTHGGQVRLPLYGALFAASLYGKRFESGRRQVDGLTLYVTRGIGLEGGGAPRVRFLCSPEVILWELDGC
jgi:predicted MPP superfamily phosphohydrolase